MKTALVLTGLLFVPPSPTPSPLPDPTPPPPYAAIIGGELDQDVAGLQADWRYEVNRPGVVGSSKTNGGQRTAEIRDCYFGLGEILNFPLCTAEQGWSKVLDCGADQTLALPYGIREARPDAHWHSEGTPHCADPAQPAAIQLHEIVEREFTSLPIAPSPLSIQPVSGWTFVNVPTIVYTDATPQLLNTTLLGISIEVEVTPTSFTWDFNDPHNPNSIITNDPGLHYPDHTLEHTYTHTGNADITLTTNWTGRFRTDTSTQWTTIDGTATTTTTAPTLEIREATSRLVEDPLN